MNATTPVTDQIATIEKWGSKLTLFQKRAGQENSWLARCPVCNSGSLQIGLPNGEITLQCMRKCSELLVMKRLNELVASPAVSDVAPANWDYSILDGSAALKAAEYVRTLFGHLPEFKTVPTNAGVAYSWEACCPAHEDRNASLALNVKPNGTLLVHCFADCTLYAVVDALYLSREKEAQNPWDKFLGLIKSKVSINTFATWFQPTRLNRAEGDTLYVQIPSAVFRQVLTRTYGEIVKAAIEQMGTPKMKVQYVCAEEESVQAPPKDNSITQEWGAVIPLDNILRPVLPFLEKFLPKAIRPYCADVALRMSVPMDFVGIAGLETLFGAVGRRAFVYPKAADKTWSESLTLSGGVVASSGAIKSPTWKMFTNLLVEQEADWGRMHRQECAQYEKDLGKWEAAVKDDANVADLVVKPEPPLPSRRLILNDATPEKAHSMMADNPAGLFYYRDELSSWVDELDKEGRETQRGLFLQAMNGDDAYTMDRIGRGSVTATMSLGVAGNFQPDLLRRFLADERNVQDGMMPRFTLMVWPDTAKRNVIDKPADRNSKEAFRNIVRGLAGLAPESVRFHFDKGAQAIFLDWLQGLYEKIDQESHPGKQAHLSKWAGALPKFAALSQLIDMVAMGGRFEGDFQIDEEHTQGALEFFEYLESHMHRIYDSAYSSAQVIEITLVERIQKGDMADLMTARDIQRKHWKGIEKDSPVQHVEEALENLAEKNWVRSVVVMPGPMGGRPSVRWEINPKARCG